VNCELCYVNCGLRIVIVDCELVGWQVNGMRLINVYVDVYEYVYVYVYVFVQCVCVWVCGLCVRHCVCIYVNLCVRAVIVYVCVH